MATYNETVEYFEDLCVKNLQIAHLATPGKKKFFRLNMKEFLSGAIKDLPNHSEGPFCILINYISDVSTPTHAPLETKQLMFYILHGYKNLDYDGETLARTVSESVMNQFMLRFQYDSQNDHPFFNHAFDQIQRFRKVPAEIQTANGLYVGWQGSMYLPDTLNECYNPLNWLSE